MKLSIQEISNINWQLARLVAILEVRQQDYDSNTTKLCKQINEGDLAEARKVKAMFFNKVILRKEDYETAQAS